MFLYRLFWRIKLILRTKSYKKENLVIVNGFGTNSIILKGLVEYLSEFFNVYFINLPGFVPDKRSLLTISVDNYAEYVEKQIADLKINDYILAGISFGFYVISKSKLEKRCKALFAIEPYVGGDSLEINQIEKTFLDTVISFLTKSEIESIIWENKYFPKILKIFSEASQEDLLEVVKYIDSKTFFETAKLILENHDTVEFKNKPYILAINDNDGTLNAKYVKDLFIKHAPDLFFIPITTDHYPKELTRKYFERHIPEDRVYKMIQWLELMADNKKKEKNS